MTFSADNHTFVVCAYKENPFLPLTLDSLMAQTVSSHILLSTSTPNEYLSDICKRYGVKMVVNPHPHRAGDDWNYAYHEAQTPLVTLAHQDDYYAPRFLEKTLEGLNGVEAEGALLAFTDYFEIREGNRVDSNVLLKVKRIMNAPFSHKALNGSRTVKRRVLSLGCPICCPAVTLVKSNIGQPPFDTTLKNSCDYKTWVDLANRPGRFLFISEKLLGHRIYAESATSRNLGENIRKKEDMEILSSLWPRPIANIINKVYSLSEKSNDL